MFTRARLRLTLWYAGAFTAILVVLAVAAYAVMARELNRQIDDSLRDSMSALVHSPLMAHLGDGGPRPPGPRGLSTDVFYFVIGPRGELVQDPRGFDASELPIDSLIEAAPRSKPGTHDFRADGEHYRVLTLGFELADGEVYTLAVGRSLEARDYQLRLLAVVLGLGGIPGILLASVGGFFLAGRALVPIRQSLETQRRFVSDASHELRTPIAVVKANAELLLRHPDQTIESNIDQVAAINEESDHLSRLVGDLLTLARADEGRVTIAREPVDLDELFAAVLRDMEALAEAREIDLRSDLRAGTVTGDPQRLRQLLAILLDNALKFSPPGGRVTVESRRSGSRVTFSVTDTGPGIPPGDLSRVFERFYRADKARGPQAGTGLGLAIAKWIVEAHHGRISAESPGQGARFVVRLPVG